MKAYAMPQAAAELEDMAVVTMTTPAPSVLWVGATLLNCRGPLKQREHLCHKLKNCLGEADIKEAITRFKEYPDHSMFATVIADNIHLSLRTLVCSRSVVVDITAYGSEHTYAQARSVLTSFKKLFNPAVTRERGHKR